MRLALCTLVGIVSGLPSLEETYGSVAVVSSVTSWGHQNGSAFFETALYTSVRTPEKCDFPIDLVLVEDTGASSAEHLELLKSAQFRILAQTLSITHPGSRFGVVAYRDKPVWGLGALDDYCYKVLLPLSPWPIDLLRASPPLTAGSKEGVARNQLGALVAAAESPEVGWSGDSAASRLAVLSTRSLAHYADDGMNSYGMLPFSGHLNTSQADAQCTREYYPSPAQVRAAIQSQQIYLATLVDSMDQSSASYQQSWPWFNSYLEQTPDFVQSVVKDIAEPLTKIIKHLEDIECTLQTTTVAPTDQPSTTPLTTIPSTSAAASETTLTSSTAETTNLTPTAETTIVTPSAQTAIVTPTAETTIVTPTPSTTAPIPPTSAFTEGDTSSALPIVITENTVEETTPSQSVETESEAAGSVTPAGDFEEASSVPASTSVDPTDCKADDEVVIRLKHRPMRLNLEVENE